MLKEQILVLFRERIRQEIENSNLDFEKIQEIRIRVGKPIILMENGREHIVETKITLRDILDIVETA